jgi:3-isopropylmalate/(R)-2-methylmalate dehydratase large subunit
MGNTITEKVIGDHAGRDVQPGDVVVVDVDAVMATDTTAPYAIEAFRDMGGTEVWDPEKAVLIIDHAAPAPTERIANLHSMMRKFAEEQGCPLHDIGSGIGHQVMVDHAYAQPGDLVVGADSHSVIYGALGAYATGVGSTDCAAILRTGKLWLKVPPTIKVELAGQKNPGVTAKDLTLAVVGEFGLDGATYKTVEYTGAAAHDLSLDGRMTLSSMSVEMGGAAGIVDPVGLDLPYEWTPVRSDPDAEYEAEHTFDVSGLDPMVALPHFPDKVKPIDVAVGTPIDMAFIGTCTNGRLEDLHAAADIVRRRTVAPGVRFIIGPASRGVLEAAMDDGTMRTLSKAGASFLTPGCGPCVGKHMGVPGDGETVISAANRNFQGRMGNPAADIYLSSPAAVAASALRGEITNPADVIQDQEPVPA